MVKHGQNLQKSWDEEFEDIVPKLVNQTQYPCTRQASIQILSLQLFTISRKEVRRNKKKKKKKKKKTMCQN